MELRYGEDDALLRGEPKRFEGRRAPLQGERSRLHLDPQAVLFGERATWAGHVLRRDQAPDAKA